MANALMILICWCFGKESRKKSLFPMLLLYSPHLLHVLVCFKCVPRWTAVSLVISAETQSATRLFCWAWVQLWNALESVRDNKFKRCELILCHLDHCLRRGCLRLRSIPLKTIGCNFLSQEISAVWFAFVQLQFVPKIGYCFLQVSWSSMF